MQRTVERERTGMIEPDLPEVVSAAGFDAFFRREYPALVALTTAIVGDRHGAEDIAQEALLRAQQRWDRLAAYDRPGAWARRVAINLATNRRARMRSEATALVRLASRPPLIPPDPDVDDFWAAVRELPPRQAAAIALYYLEDRSVADVADALGCAVNTAKVHLSRGRSALARRLGEEVPS